MLFFRKLFKLPNPVELGWSSVNALTTEDWRSEGDTSHTWEDWHKTVKKEFPIKYFLAETLPDFIRYKLWFPVKKPISNIYWWAQYHLNPQYQYHILKLSQSNKNKLDCDYYKYGWCDADRRMLFALFNILNEFVEKEMPEGYYVPSEDEALNDPGMKVQRDYALEIKNIYIWWNIDRKNEYRSINQLQSKWWAAKKSKDRAKAENLWKDLQSAKDSFDNKEDEMISRLMKVRRSLWT